MKNFIIIILFTLILFIYTQKEQAPIRGYLVHKSYKHPPRTAYPCYRGYHFPYCKCRQSNGVCNLYLNSNL